MFAPTWRRLMLFAVFLSASMAAPSARAQDPLGLPGDLLVLKVRELQAKRDRARLQDDINRGDAAAVNRDLRLVRRHERDVQMVRRWAQRDLFLPPGFYPMPPRAAQVPVNPSLIPHPQYPGYGYFPSDPDHLYRLPEGATGTTEGATAAASTAGAADGTRGARMSIEIVNTAPAGTTVTFFINGVAYQIEGGGRRKLDVRPRSTIAYDRIGGLGRWRYTLSSGVYEFQPLESGWALFKVGPSGPD
jgi:hypothetical protein